MKVKTRIINKEINTPKLSYALEGDAGIDLTATSKWYDDHGNVCYGTNRALAIPKGFVGLLFPRSSVSKKDLSLANCVGVIDSNYRGEIIFKFKPTLSYQEQDMNEPNYFFLDDYEVEERIGQIIIIESPEIEFEEVDDLDETNRNDGGFGSTGK